MKINQFYLMTLTVLFLAAVSCKKDFITPTTETDCSTCSCLEFDSTGINESFTSSTYGAVFYYQANIALTGKYVDYLQQGGSNPGVSDVIPLTGGFQNENSNFSGEILRFANNDVLFDYSNYPSLSKTVAFDVNGNLGDYTFKVNGVAYNNLPSNISITSTALANGYHVEVSGAITSIELGGWELAIDNMCLTDYTPANSCSTVSS